MKIRHQLLPTLIALSIACFAHVAFTQGAQAGDRQKHPTRTPIEHVIVVVGETHSFDNLFGTYKPSNGQTVNNLLSQGIINADGSPGPHFAKAAQQQAGDTDIYASIPSRRGRTHFCHNRSPTMLIHD